MEGLGRSGGASRQKNPSRENHSRANSSLPVFQVFSLSSSHPSPTCGTFIGPLTLLRPPFYWTGDRLRLSLQPITFKTSSFLSLSVSFASLSSSLHPRAASSAFYFTPPVLRCTVLYTPRRNYAKRRGKMPPKKQVEEKKILLGRPGNNLKSGIVGHPVLCSALPLCAAENSFIRC